MIDFIHYADKTTGEYYGAISGIVNKDRNLVQIPNPPDTGNDYLWSKDKWVLDVGSLSEQIKEEVSERIYNVASKNMQMNLASFAGAGLMTESQKGSYKLALLWVKSMLETKTKLIESADITFAEDKHWPIPDPKILELITTFKL